MAEKKQVEQAIQEEFKNVTIVNKGTQIVLPQAMNIPTAMVWLKRRLEEDERQVLIHEAVDCLPLEGAYYLGQALRNICGFFDGAENAPKPHQIALEVGFAKTEQVMWGYLQAPGIDGFLETESEVANGNVRFRLDGRVKSRNRPLVNQIVKEIKRLAKEESIYAGKAIHLTFPDPGDDDFNPVLYQHRFMDISRINPAQLIFPAITQQLVEDTLFAPVLYTEAVRKAGIPLKRGVLLEGPYGCGKTLTEYVLALYASQNGWTYGAIENAKDLAKAMEWAKRYQPAIIAAEDIDRADIDGGRTDNMNHILNTIDGASFKDSEIIVVLTTNHVEKITPAMMRPGRLDAVIPVRPPDWVAVQRLIRLYAGELLDMFEPLDTVSLELAGQIPAVIREVVERSKLSAISRLQGSGTLSINEADLLIAAAGMKDHLRLMAPKVVDLRSNEEKAAAILGQHIVRASNPDEVALRDFVDAE